MYSPQLQPPLRKILWGPLQLWPMDLQVSLEIPWEGITIPSYLTIETVEDFLHQNKLRNLWLGNHQAILQVLPGMADTQAAFQRGSAHWRSRVAWKEQNSRPSSPQPHAQSHRLPSQPPRHAPEGLQTLQSSPSGSTSAPLAAGLPQHMALLLHVPSHPAAVPSLPCTRRAQPWHSS